MPNLLGSYSAMTHRRPPTAAAAEPSEGKQSPFKEYYLLPEYARYWYRVPADWFIKWSEVDTDGEDCRTKKPGIRHGDMMSTREHDRELPCRLYGSVPSVARNTLDWRGAHRGGARLEALGAGSVLRASHGAIFDTEAHARSVRTMSRDDAAQAAFGGQRVPSPPKDYYLI
jgi:hypothetical protein